MRSIPTQDKQPTLFVGYNDNVCHYSDIPGKTERIVSIHLYGVQRIGHVQDAYTGGSIG
ncbi:hypothetical protein [Candidatus Amarolinea dominans]|uniref:hypothetical protein n=1 Tax=Candidatus Amarolinea dominans TaxID=3140696 RepID=UPI0031CC9F7E